ncbi:hypothetical protein GCM10008098_08740 [Rhodanobacter panaciterrae]|uniref:Molecular chaperone DnaK (HSP70) n=1 Tax=Rhodanobacter panaciterrae TaxID=490572 RepID=A0ABQ2ZL49_9GAMM|nr:hypothetical protein [Rhodanobacter panaciterrae]GGY18872.1 hypothetical protein GCM10008098_08740 [Rhodanobacter panaciterrae]
MSNQLDEVIQLLRGIDDKVAALDSRMSAMEQRVGELADRAEVNVVPIVLHSKALSMDEAEDRDVLLCLDFGTARSKAFATKGSDDVLIDVAVGSRAGSAEPHSILSCVFVGDDRQIYFGEVAAAKSELAVNGGVRKRIDSFKGMITNANPGSDLRENAYDKAHNPTNVKLSEGEVLSLYLGYLTDMAVTDLAERHQLSRYVKRRFTTPVFADGHKQWASATLRRHYAEAVLLADHFHGHWQEGIDVDAAKSALIAVAKQHDVVEYLLVDSEVEPVAAFGSRFRNYEPKVKQRRIVSIIDAGAGTTDFASFALVEQPGEDVAMFLIPGSVHAVRKAGNEVDRILCEFILDKWKQAEFDAATVGRIRADLSLQQRGLKERLFRESRVTYTLADDTNGIVELPEFLESEKVKQLSGDLRAGFEKSLGGIHPSWLKEGAQGELVVIVTGGSSSLPMILELASLQVTALSIPLKCQAAPTIPKWVDQYDELRSQFPQLAVAIGGASRELPRLAPSTFSEFSGLSDQGAWVIEPAMKGA